MRTSNELALSAVDASTTQNSSAIRMGFNQLFSAQGQISGSANCTVKLQFSDDPDTVAPTNWSDVPNSSASVTSASSYSFQSLLTSYEWVRVTSSNNSGTGTLTVRVKSFGMK